MIRNRLRASALALLFAAGVASPAFAQSAHIRFHGGSVAFIAGVNWGGGTLYYHGKAVRLRVNGLSVGAIGANSFDAEGDVYHLHRLSDIQGTYAAIGAGATVGGGAGAIDMQNGAGVEIRAHSTSAGLKLEAGPSGVTIQIK